MPQVSSYSAADHSKAVKQCYLTWDQSPNMALRLQHHMQALLGCPYLLGACGEGPAGEFDQKPLCRADAVDCLTFVNLVLALSLAPVVDAVEPTLIKLNYYDETVSYHKRFHWMSLDWLPENERSGRLSPLSLDHYCPPQKAVAMIAQKQWFLNKTTEDLCFIDEQPEFFLLERLSLLHKKSDEFSGQQATLNYYAINHLLSSWTSLLETLPSVSLMVVVRPPKDANSACMALVSHVGFVVKKSNDLFFVHAKQGECVCEENLAAYLSRYSHHPHIRGVSFYGISA